jgi:peptidoglycan/LPS O-acetylase OafA/YrhL
LKKTIHTPDEGRYVAVADGIRAVSIFIIAWYHIWQQSWLTPYVHVQGFTFSLDPLVRTGYLFVDVLLLLSGFLLYLPIARGERLDVGRFFAHRALRILPSYYLSVLLVLFLDALPNGAYASAAELLRDLVPHLTFTHVFFGASYNGTHLNVVLWTLAVEVQFYLLFPLLARAFQKRPALTYIGMTAFSFAYRALVIARAQDTTLLVNQLAGFLDVYANGFVCATLYARWKRRGIDNAATRVVSSLLFVAVVPLFWALMKRQSAWGTVSYEMLRCGQMILRYPLSLLACLAIGFGANAGICVRALMGGRMMRFFASISFQFYIWHQYFAVKLKKWGFPPSVSSQPHIDGEVGWQYRYTFCAFGLALIIAVVLTYAFEKPIARYGARKYREWIQSGRRKAAGEEMKA